MCHCLTLSLHSVACSCLDLHHKTLKSLTQTVTSDCRWNQLFVFSPMSISDRITCINPGLRQAMNSATLLHDQGHRRYNNDRSKMLHKSQRSKPRAWAQHVCAIVCVCVCVCSGWAWMESHWSSLIWQLTFFHCYSYNIYKYSNNNCINKKKKHIFHKKWIQLERFENQ